MLASLWTAEGGFKNEPFVSGAVLPELLSVHRADVLDWAGKREVRRFSDIQHDDVADLFESAMPGKPDGLIPMEPLHRAIYQLAVTKRK